MLNLGLLALATLLVAAAGQPPQFNQGSDQYKRLQEQLRPSYRLTVPSISGPVPLILLVSGCSGFSPPNYADRARRLVASGHAVAYVDYLRARNLNDACDASRASINVADIGEFVVAAAADLQQDPLIDRNRVFVVGWSLGGGGVLSAMNALPLGRSPITAAAALYPACRGVSPWKTPVPTLLLLGDLDNIQPPELCHALVKAVGLPSVHVRSYARAHHAFDAIELPTVMEATRKPTVGYNPDAAASAWDAILDFFRRSAAEPAFAAGGGAGFEPPRLKRKPLARLGIDFGAMLEPAFGEPVGSLRNALECSEERNGCVRFCWWFSWCCVPRVVIHQRARICSCGQETPTTRRVTSSP